MDTNGKNRTLILVDDCEEDRSTFCNLAKEKGYQVKQAKSTLEAIQQVQKNGTVAVLVIDESVSSPPGAYQTFDYIRHELKIKQAVLIACKEDTVVEQAEKKYLGFTNKPFSVETFNKIENWANRQENVEKPVQKAYSLNYLRDISEGDEEFIIDSLKIFQDSVASKLSEIRASLDKKEYKTIGDIAHNIKPSFEMLESSTGKELCNKIVYQAPEQEIPDLITALNQEFNKIHEQLVKDFPKLALS